MHRTLTASPGAELTKGWPNGQGLVYECTAQASIPGRVSGICLDLTKDQTALMEHKILLHIHVALTP